MLCWKSSSELSFWGGGWLFCFVFVYGPHPVVLGGYFWLCTQGTIWGCQGLNLDQQCPRQMSFLLCCCSDPKQSFLIERIYKSRTPNFIKGVHNKVMGIIVLTSCSCVKRAEMSIRSHCVKLKRQRKKKKKKIFISAHSMLSIVPGHFQRCGNSPRARFYFSRSVTWKLGSVKKFWTWKVDSSYISASLF